MAQTIRMSIDTDQLVGELIRTLNRLPRVARQQVRIINAAIAEEEADNIRFAADGAGAQAALAGDSVRVRAGSSPAIAAGGNVTVRPGARGGRVTGSDVFFGSEFGGQGRDTTMQFPPHQGKQGYWFWPTLREDTPDIIDQWVTVLDDLADTWRYR